MPAKKTRAVKRAKGPAPRFMEHKEMGSKVEGSPRGPKGAAKGPQSRQKMTEEALKHFIEMGRMRGMM